MNDKVNNPKHYTSHPSGVECIQITEYYNFCIGNAIKYLWRQGLKTEDGYSAIDKQVEDCKKAIFYINRHIDNLTKRTEPIKTKPTSIHRHAVADVLDREAKARAKIQTMSAFTSPIQKSWLESND